MKITSQLKTYVKKIDLNPKKLLGKIPLSWSLQICKYLYILHN